MARTGKLKAIQVSKAPNASILHDGGGLYLRVSRTGAKSWVYRFQIDGRRRDMGLGPYPEISLAEARERAQTYRRQKIDRIDPLDARRESRRVSMAEARRGLTFEVVARQFIDRQRAGWRNAKHALQWTSTLETYVYPIMGNLPVASIDTQLVVRTLDPIWTSKPETASRVRGRVEAILDAAIAQGLRERPNPAEWKGNLAHILPSRSRLRKTSHHAALAIDELPAFVAELRRREATAARAFEFMILTATRTSETLGSRWGEYDLGDKVWTIPAVRMKAGQEHRVPLSSPAAELLVNLRALAMTRAGDVDPTAPVFPGNRRAIPLSNMVFLMLLRRMGRGDITAHGFRSTFSDWAAERTSTPREVVEMALAHTIANKVEAAYRRGDLFEKRRELMGAWARFCLGEKEGGT